MTGARPDGKAPTAKAKRQYRIQCLAGIRPTMPMPDQNGGLFRRCLCRKAVHPADTIEPKNVSRRIEFDDAVLSILPNTPSSHCARNEIISIHEWISHSAYQVSVITSGALRHPVPICFDIERPRYRTRRITHSQSAI
jgi:hypothetical protein